MLHTTISPFASNKFCKLAAAVLPRSQQNFTLVAELHRGSNENFLPVVMLRGRCQKN